MSKKSEQQFLKELDDKLWKAADRLRNNLDAANYKHVVLGIIFLKYVSDAFEERQNELRQLFTDGSGDDNIYYMPREDYESNEEYQDAINEELELHEDVKGFCYSATLEEIEKHDFVLTPGRYVGAAEQEEDTEPFSEKMERLKNRLRKQFEESGRLETEIKKNLAGLGYEF